MTFELCGERQMERFGEALAPHLRRGMLVTLSGDFGAGKTTLARGIVRGLGGAADGEPVISPTYTLVQSYAAGDGAAVVHHFDLYRLESVAELENIGFRDYLDGAGICLFEWPERCAGLLPQPALAIEIGISEPCRKVTMRAADPERWTFAFDTAHI